jgi:hypothetical protein
MKIARRILAALGVILTIGPSLAYFGDTLTLPQVKGAMLAGVAVWFVAVVLVRSGAEA